jgi:hypothetical protein
MFVWHLLLLYVGSQAALLEATETIFSPVAGCMYLTAAHRSVSCLFPRSPHPAMSHNLTSPRFVSSSPVDIKFD